MKIAGGRPAIFQQKLIPRAAVVEAAAAKAIAACTFCLNKLSIFQVSIDSSVDRAPGSSARGLRFKSRLSQWNSSKKCKILFLIEDISELEC